MKKRRKKYKLILKGGESRSKSPREKKKQGLERKKNSGKILEIYFTLRTKRDFGKESLIAYVLKVKGLRWEDIKVVGCDR